MGARAEKGGGKDSVELTTIDTRQNINSPALGLFCLLLSIEHSYLICLSQVFPVEKCAAVIRTENGSGSILKEGRGNGLVALKLSINKMSIT